MDLKQLKTISRDESSIFRLNVNAGGLRFTWAADDRLIVSGADGVNMANPPNRAFHSNVYECLGAPPTLSFEEMPHYPHMPMRVVESDFASFWGGACLAVGTTLYQFLMTTNHPYLKPDATFWPGFRSVGSKLIYSPDGGRTWRNQDGSAPVRWNNWLERSKGNMAFFDEKPDGAFSWPTFLQMGRGYRANRDGYVYVYSLNGDLPEDARDLVLFRVRTERMTDRPSYEFYSGRNGAGSATWTRDIERRAIIHRFPPAWISSSDKDGMLPFGWNLSVVYNEALDFYLMVAQGNGVAGDGSWFGKPSYLGFWAAPTPWGPFEQFHEDTAWCPGGDAAARAFAPEIPSKFISEDGRSFWLVWSDYRFRGASGETLNPDKSFLEVVRDITDDAEFARVMHEWTAKNMTGGKRMQKIRLVIE